MLTSLQIINAERITNEEYNDLSLKGTLIYEGQSRLDKHGFYKMFWSNGSKIYFTKNKI